ncbi:MAG: hypothetical protein HWD62_19380 [Cyclobacteriaceae bacterium]|nr:MAG: hypothetical protein HWD62_19380 [Cyclobacteriaceae bacterium]
MLISKLSKVGSLSIFLIAGSVLGVAQDFKIKKLEQVGDKINLYYDLLDSTENSKRNYSIYLYASRDSYTSPLTKVTGDIGQIVRTGENKKITWNAKEELGADFEGKISLEIRGKEFVPFLKLDGFNNKKPWKRGVLEDITWSGGRANSLINFELYKNGKFVAAPHTSIATSLGKYSILIPKSIKPGGGYTFRIADSKNREEYIFTEEFSIRRKFPLAAKTLAFAGVGAAMYFLIQSDANNDIPDPLDIGKTTGKN